LEQVLDVLDGLKSCEGVVEGGLENVVLNEPLDESLNEPLGCIEGGLKHDSRNVPVYEGGDGEDDKQMPGSSNSSADVAVSVDGEVGGKRQSRWFLPRDSLLLGGDGRWRDSWDEEVGQKMVFADPVMAF
jgi:hypothetical protein